MPPSIRIALVPFMLGFLLEGATEVYQLATLGASGPLASVLYYIGIATTLLGFFYFYRGQQQWKGLHRTAIEHGHRHLLIALSLFGGGTVAVAVLSLVEHATGGSGVLLALGWLAGGLFALALGNFFLSLITIVRELLGRLARLVSWAAFGWSLGVAVLAGWVISVHFVEILRVFFTDPLGLVGTFAPLALALSPLFVTYFLLTAVYWEAYRKPLPQEAEGPEAPGPAQRP
jgi:hypothetical protein